MTLSLGGAALQALEPYLGARAEGEWASRVRVVLLDGRVAVPCEHRYEVLPPGGYPEDWPVWSPIVALATHPLLVRRYDGRPPQAETYQLEALSCGTKLLALLLGIGAGKTVIGSIKLATAAMLNPGGLSIIAFPSNKTPWLNKVPLYNTQVPKFEAYLPPWAIRIPRHRSVDGFYGRLDRHGFYEISWKNNHVTIMTTLDYTSRAYLRAQGPDACFLWLDEASIMHPRAIKTILERVRDDSGMLCQALFTTSLDEPGFLEGLFLADSIDESMMHVIRVPSEAATFRGPEYFDMLRKVLTPDEYRRKVGAELVHYEGLVYDQRLMQDIRHPTWLPAKPTTVDHPWLPRWPGWWPRPEIPVSIGVDFGETRSCAVLSQEAMVLGELCDVVYDEILLSVGSAHHLAQVIKERTKGFKTVEIFTDYSTTSEPDRRAMRAILKGTSVRPAVTEANSRYYRVHQGVSLIRSQCVDHEGRRHLYLADALHGSVTHGPDLMGLREAIGAYRWPAHKKRIHILDALRYLILGKRVPRGTVEGFTYGR